MSETCLNKNDVKEILKEFREKIRSIIKGKFIELILFGSYARGDYEFGSDIDVLVVVKERLTGTERKRISKILSDISLAYDTVIACFDYPYTEFETRNSPFLLNVRREGIKI